MSSMIHFHTAFPQVTNFLPVLVWNGYSQEHHSMVSTQSNQRMLDYWRGNGFAEVILIDAKEFDDQNQPGDYVDSTAFSLEQRLAFTEAVLVAANQAAQSALGGKLTVLILKQLKGAGVHARGAKSHNLYAYHTLDNPEIVAALQGRSLSPAAWMLVRANLSRAGGGPAAHTVVTEAVLPLATITDLPLEEFPRWRRPQGGNHRHGAAGGQSRGNGPNLSGNQCRRQRSLRDWQHQPGPENYSPHPGPALQSAADGSGL